MTYKRKYIKRPVYLDRISPYVDKDIIKVLVGQRRVGKSKKTQDIASLVMLPPSYTQQLAARS